MIISILILFTLLALALDYFILRRNLPKIKWLTVLYITQAVLLDVCICAWLVISIFAHKAPSNNATIIMLWVMLAFIMSFASKVTFSLFSGVEWLLSRIYKRRFHGIIYAGFTLVAGVLAIMVYGTALGRNDLRVERVTIHSDQLPEAFDGFTIAQFSDAHLGNLGESSTLISDLVTKINTLNPDLVVQSGDLVNIHSDELTPAIMQTFGQLKAPVYAVLGNHDMGYYIRDKSLNAEQSVDSLISKFKTMGWHLLQNEHLWLHRASDSIALGGVGYPVDGRFGVRNNSRGGSDLSKTLRGVADSTFSLLISHTPSLFDSIPQLATPNLTLSGHVHSMQAKITIGQWRWSPAKLLFPMWSGLYTVAGRHLYVNDGIGYALYPMRIGVRPEITLYTLKSGKIL